ncbi:glycosyltransferase [Pedobacter xixiisoli]|uniref:Glycosyl transferase family 1 domain-containing protein n=1 Tax=Pedobacter xixiisoli TaxID=1476464 RepID=A0A286AD89_9SPHI|nr:glycosyltransferase [Pedobacter xixiisoli]SOD19858.1 hypothetical protein SAMN06297358_3565 [Pedobacter xixiisoli]
MFKKIFKKRDKEAINQTLINNLYQTTYDRHVLISYIVTPFKVENNFLHQNYFTAHLITEAFSELGYNVDVVDFISKTEHINYEKYQVVFGFGYNFEQSFYHKMQNNSIRILFVTGAHEEFQNMMSLKCVEDFYQLSKLWLPSESKVLAASTYYAMHSSDIVVILAESHIYNDFRTRFKNTLCSLNNNIIGAFAGLAPKTAASRTANFLYLSGAYQLAKGLHILLEVVKLRSDLNFYIVLPSLNPELEEYYYEVLHKRKNVFLFKNIRMDSVEMREIIEKCSYTLSPSYVDGLPGGTIEPMSAGLIPIVSKYCGFAKKDFIFEMDELTIDCLMQNIEAVLALSDEYYLQSSNKVKNYTLENFSVASVKDSFKKIMTENLR